MVVIASVSTDSNSHAGARDHAKAHSATSGSPSPQNESLAATAIVLAIGPMNETHLQFLASPEWAKMLETDLLPWILEAGDLGDDVLEIGPGPGLIGHRLIPWGSREEGHPI